MTTIVARTRISTARKIGHAVLFTRIALLFSSTLIYTTPAAAHGFPLLEQRGSHGAHQIVNIAQPKTENREPIRQTDMQNTQPSISVKPKKQPQILIQQGSHGVYRVLEQKGVGGPQDNGKYRGFPTLKPQGSHGADGIVTD